MNKLSILVSVERDTRFFELERIESKFAEYFDEYSVNLIKGNLTDNISIRECFIKLVAEYDDNIDFNISDVVDALKSISNGKLEVTSTVLGIDFTSTY